MATSRLLNRVPAPTYFVTSAVFHYFGPSLAVLLFARLDVLGVMWLRIVTAAVIFALWRRPWRRLAELSGADRAALIALGGTLGAMNALFYLAIDRLPLATVGAIEFLGPIVLAAIGVRTPRNLLALLLVIAGVAVLTTIQFAADPVGFALAFGNAALFGLYLVLGHRVANARSGSRSNGIGGLDRLALAMIIAAVAAAPVGLVEALPALTDPSLLAWGVAVGVCSSVVPYVADQLAMARLPRSTFALMLALLPVTATVLGLLLLSQVPSVRDLAGIALVVGGIAFHRRR